MDVGTPELPECVDEWKLKGPAQRITADTIFDYMNGAGELYLAYHFIDLTVSEYGNGGDNDILVEIYRLKDAADAFGLLSLDWGGESVAVGPSPARGPDRRPSPYSEVLYGAGLLRMRSGNLYIRIMAVRDTPQVKKVILRLAHALTAGRDNPPPPELVRRMPEALGAGWELNRETIGYFYSHLVMNSWYYLSHENILNLGPETESVVAAYENGSGTARVRIRVLVICYSGPREAAEALDRFRAAYLPGAEPEIVGGGGGGRMALFHVEDGWLGVGVAGRLLAAFFACPSLEAARGLAGRFPFLL